MMCAHYYYTDTSIKQTSFLGGEGEDFSLGSDLSMPKEKSRKARPGNRVFNLKMHSLAHVIDVLLRGAHNTQAIHIADTSLFPARILGYLSGGHTPVPAVCIHKDLHS